jgi:hypothetical protein
MKTKVLNGESKKKDFPKLMISESGNIILFKKWGVGTIIVSESNENIGNHYTDFAMELFSDFDGEILLRNNQNK